uniref:Phosphoesterase n=1 Tax=Arcella intermedia TaxID=1963864 RepID=A0A6B2L347_9EUKA
MVVSWLSLLACGQGMPIKNVITIMMENRSFDHLLGFLHLSDPAIDGLDGSEYNLVDTKDPTSEKVFVNQNGYDEGPDDPGHGWEDTAEEIYGVHDLKPPIKLEPKMIGFAQNAKSHGHSTLNPLSMFTSKTAPVINGLATEFAVFDAWFCSLPGPTDPNRGFWMSGTSNGAITNYNGTHWSQQSYFDFLRTKGVSWRAYYQDDPWAIMYFQDMHLKVNHQNVFTLDQFFTDLKSNSLSRFSLLQPRMTTTAAGPPTWQHPDASVTEGERLLKSIYEAFRASSYWNDTVLVITYDEHGGFYDHVPPPEQVPAPDSVVAPNGFTFERLGIRVPTVAISPWIPKGTIVHKPSGPQPNSEYDSTSLMSTANKIFGITEHLGLRAAWSGTFENIFSTTMRTDCPTTLIDIPMYTQETLDKQRSLPLNDHMSIQVQFYCQENNLGEDCGKDIVNQGQASDFIVREAQRFMHNLASN